MKQALVLECEQKSVQVEFRWLKLSVCQCNANYTAEQVIDAKFR